jgi:hypothetical protein
MDKIPVEKPTVTQPASAANDNGKYTYTIVYIRLIFALEERG